MSIQKMKPWTDWPHPMDANVEPPAKATEEPDRGAQVLGVDHPDPDLVIEVDHAAGPGVATEIVCAPSTAQTWIACEVFIGGVSIGKMDATFSVFGAAKGREDDLERFARNAAKRARRAGR